MIPLFKSDFSIGKSILTLNSPDPDPAKADSAFEIAEDLGLSAFVLVEDCLTGFLQAKKVSEELDLQLVFGLRISLADEEASAHKVIIFAKNDEGCRLLNRIYSHAFCEGDGALSSADLKAMWSEEALRLAVPFYDSFIFNNFMSYNNCLFEVNFTNPTFFIESNDLPFDPLVEQRVFRVFSEKRPPNGARQEYLLQEPRGTLRLFKHTSVFVGAVPMVEPALYHAPI